MPFVGSAAGGDSLLAGTLMQCYLEMFIVHLRPYTAAIEDWAFLLKMQYKKQRGLSVVGLFYWRCGGVAAPRISISLAQKWDARSLQALKTTYLKLHATTLPHSATVH
jgi:hypothetical protein